MIVRWVLGNQDGLLYVLSRLADRRYWRCLLLFRVFMSLPRYADTWYAVKASEGWLLVLHMWLSTILSEARLHHVPPDFRNSLNWGNLNISVDDNALHQDEGFSPVVLHVGVSVPASLQLRPPLPPQPHATPHSVPEKYILFKKLKSGLMTFYIVPNYYIYIIWYISDLIGCAVGAQWAVFLTLLFAKLESCNFVCG